MVDFQIVIGIHNKTFVRNLLCIFKKFGKCYNSTVFIFESITKNLLKLGSA